MSQLPIAFVVVGTQRTGTSLIRTSLNSHQDIRCHGEVFKLGRKPYAQPDGYWAFVRAGAGRRVRSWLMPDRFVEAYLDQMYGNTDCKAVGFKLMWNQCEKKPHVWEVLVRKQARAIWVRRNNVLKTLVSRRAAEATGVYHVSESLQVGGAVRQRIQNYIELPIATLITDLAEIESESSRWRDRLQAGMPFIEVQYETYIGDSEAGNRAMLEFLGVPVLALHSDLEKVNPEKLSEVVRNYEDVARALTGSRFESCLDG